MGLPLSFLAGLLVVFAHRELLPPIPGSGSLGTLLPYGLLWLVPSVLAGLALLLMRRQLVHGKAAAVPPRALLRLSAFATPLVLHLSLGVGGYAALAAGWAGSSHVADILLLLAPLLVTEVPRLAIGTATMLCGEIDDEFGTDRKVAAGLLPTWRDVRPVFRLRLGWPLLLLMPCLLLGAALDLLATNRKVYTFCLSTSVGSTLATIAFLALAAMVLPFWFRFAFGTVRQLPEPIGQQLRRTAAALGFKPSRVLLLPTGMRAMNAMMVGPLGVGRCLCITDALLRSLDADSLSGVVAHEVGHARRRHPGVLMLLAVVVPLLLASPLRLLDLDALGVAWQALVAVVVIVVGWTILRSLAHRFEHEADAVSVGLLGAAPCTRALMVVSRLAMPLTHGVFGRIFSLHPEEQRRWDHMRRYEGDPEFRGRFEADGRRLRQVVLAALAVAVVTAAAMWVADWPYERAIWRFQSGDFVASRELIAKIEVVPSRWQKTWHLLGEEVAVAVSMAPDATDWPQARTALQQRAWPRGVETLLACGPAAARPWFELAIEADEQATVLQRAICEFCEAAANNDPQRMEEIKRVVRQLGYPADLTPVFGD